MIDNLFRMRIHHCKRRVPLRAGGGVCFTITLGAAACLVAAASCVPPPDPMAMEMAEHFSRAKLVHTSLIYGELELARQSARGLVGRPAPAGLAGAVTTHHDRLREAAIEVANATGFESASLGAGQMADACGACHAASGVGPRPRATTPPPARAEAIAVHMQRYKWAVDRMWESLIGESEPAWLAGLEVLSAEPPDLRELQDEEAGYTAALAARVAELATAGERLDDRRSRSQLFGQLLTACTDCHQAARRW